MTETLLNLLTFSPTQPLLFNSGLFLFLFVAFCLGYALLSGKKNTALRLLYVTAFSYYFYYKNAGSYCALLALITFVNFGAALAMNRVESQGKRRGIFVRYFRTARHILLYLPVVELHRRRLSPPDAPHQ